MNDLRIQLPHSELDDRSPATSRGKLGLGRLLLRLGLFLLLSGLLYFALRNAPVGDIWLALAGLRWWQIAMLLSLDLLIYALVTARWWLVVRAERRDVSFWPLVAVRLSAFAVSYFTFGPQVGGEPLQVLYLRRQQGLSYTRAAASVVMDKLFEFLANFVLLAFGLIAILRSGLLAGVAIPLPAVLLLAVLMTWPFIHILLMYRGVYPLSTATQLFLGKHARSKPARFLCACERLAAQFCRRHFQQMLGAAGLSLLAAAATVSEYALITSFMHLRLPFWQIVTAWTSGWLSFLVPVPGGLGALEASQVSVLGYFGITAATAVSITLLMRGRDLFIGGLGLLLASSAARKPQIRLEEA